MPTKNSPGYELTWVEHPTYTHFTVTGDNSPQNYLAYASEFIEISRERSFRCVLVEDKLAGPRMSVMELFSVIPEATQQALGVFDVIAYVDEQIGDMAYFAETVAVNRGVNVSIFTSMDEARRWLAEKTATV